MMMNMFHTGLVLAAAMTSIGLGADVPPQAAKPLSEVLIALESGGLKSVTEISFDDGSWEVEGLRDGKPVELHVDPLTSKILSERADEMHPGFPSDGKSLPEICKQIEAAGYGPITDIDLEPAGWEIETMRNGAQRQLVVDLRTGKILSDQADD
jgi:uncharacterized membrane protein YkoI